MKDRRLGCVVTCTYSDGESEQHPSPDGQLCCPAGVIPTGRCRNGKCPVGGMK